jgi:hypothetical protein
MKYMVDVKDTSYATIEVEANSQEEAEVMAQTAYYEGRIEWRDCDVEYEARPAERERGEAR